MVVPATIAGTSLGLEIMKMQTLLLFDFMSVFYRGLHVNKDLSHEGVPTGALYGVATQIAATINLVKPTYVIVCNDTKPYMREKDFGEFKASRADGRHNDPDMVKLISISLKQCYEFLEVAGVSTLSVRGLEADDLIAIQTLMNPNLKVVAATGDSDMYQLFTEKNFFMYRGAKKGWYTREDFKNEYGIPPSQWNEVIAMTGGHNGLVKVPGIGEVTAIKILSDSTFKEKKKPVLDKHAEQIQLNMKLAKLPYYRFREWWSVKPESPSKYNERELIRWLARYGIQFTGSMAAAFRSK